MLAMHAVRKLYVFPLLLGFISLGTLFGCSKESSNKPNQITHIVLLDQQRVCPTIGRTMYDRVNTDVREVAASEGIKVTRIYKDVQGNLARKYIEKKRTNVAPALYFMTHDDRVLDTLQGNISREKIIETINKYNHPSAQMPATPTSASLPASPTSTTNTTD